MKIGKMKIAHWGEDDWADCQSAANPSTWF
jgi:hypothetical protein